jgi:hypothetical protein
MAPPLGAALALLLCASAAAQDDLPAPAGPEVGPLSPRSLVEEDLDPRVSLIDTDRLEMRIGGLLQVHTALHAGRDALLVNGDWANREGFRLRRARIGLEGRVGGRVGVLLAVNLLDADDEVGTVADAKLTYAFAPWLGVALGTGKVPFSRSALASSRTLLSIERPLSVQRLTPERRVGLTVEGQVWEGRLGYLAGVMNATEGFREGNQFGGFLAGARVELTPLGHPRPGMPGTRGVSLGASAVRDSGPNVARDAVSVDLLAAFAGASLQLEGLCQRSTPVAQPSQVFIPQAAVIDRCGTYAEAAYALFALGRPLQLVARWELFDDNRRLNDAGDSVIVSGGVNLELVRDHARAQLHYYHRRERHGLARDNDALVLSVQGSF